MTKSPVTFRLLAGAACLAALTACTNVNLPGLGTLDTGAEPRTPTAARPQPDARGVISYPNYQVAVAKRGDTINAIAGRLGISGNELARANGLPADATLRDGELILLPTRVAAAPAGTVGTTGGGLASTGGIDVTTLANDALDRAGPSGAITPAAPATSAPEPRRHTVARGETAYSIARAYNVSAGSLAQWNGLDNSLTVREGQVLLIPVASGPAPSAPEQVATSMPGQGTVVSEPPSAATPQPAVTPPPAAEAKATTATQQPIQSKQTAASDTARLLQPVSGRIIRGYQAKKNEGLDFGASAGSPVRAADGGTVAAITRDTDQVPILVLRHPNNLLTVYANVDNITVAKGDSVSRGQNIAKVRAGDPAFLHFEVRQGFDSVDPMPYLTQ